MKLVLGKLNNVYLDDIARQAPPQCTAVDAAVAFASDSTFFDTCWEAKLKLQYFGLLATGQPVANAILKKFIERSSPRFRCFLVRGHFHPKVIWWHGFGAYVGSANLTSNAWWNNVEAGILFTEEELHEHGIANGLETMFDHLRDVGTELRSEIYDALGELDTTQLRSLEGRLKEKFEKLFSNIIPNPALARVPAKGKKPSKARQEFLREWNETLELLRKLRTNLVKSGKRPTWIPEDVNPTFHLDQVLHAHYYSRILDKREEGKSGALVEKAYRQNKGDQEAAFEETLAWWSQLSNAPSNEDDFILNRAPVIHARFCRKGIENLDEDAFVAACSMMHAFNTSARQVPNETLGLPADAKRSLAERSEMLARQMWRRHSHGGRPLPEILYWFLFGDEPREVEERLWMMLREKDHKVEGLGRSILSEALGWARPDDYPPRNNRTNKALRSLGFDVRLWGSE